MPTAASRPTTAAQSAWPGHSAQPVWYVAYGSNLCAERFGCYLAGGRPRGAVRVYTGCRDGSPPAERRALMLPGGVYFALTSLTWGGGMAFYDPALPGRTAARAYLVTAGQFADIVAQEMRREPGGSLDLAEVTATGRQTIGPGRYETLLKVGEPDGVPMLTFTAPEPALDADLNAPAPAYVAMLGAGLRETYGWSPDEVAGYLSACPGVRGAWSRTALAECVAADAPGPVPG